MIAPDGLLLILAIAFWCSSEDPVTKVTAPDGVLLILAIAFWRSSEDPVTKVTAPDGVLLILATAVGLDETFFPVGP